MSPRQFSGSWPPAARVVDWAIFSDLYGVWFPDVRHPWYEKNPATVTESEFRGLVNDFDSQAGAVRRDQFLPQPRTVSPALQAPPQILQFGGPHQAH